LKFVKHTLCNQCTKTCKSVLFWSFGWPLCEAVYIQFYFLVLPVKALESSTKKNLKFWLNWSKACLMFNLMTCKRKKKDKALVRMQIFTFLVKSNCKVKKNLKRLISIRKKQKFKWTCKVNPAKGVKCNCIFIFLYA